MRGGRVRKTLLPLAVLVLVLVACGGPGPTPTRRPTSTPPPTREIPFPPLTGQGEGYAILVHRSVDPQRPWNFLKPQPGNRWVSFEVTVRNTGTAPHEYGGHHFKAHDAAGAEYRATYGEDTDPIGSGALQPGAERRGWVNFEIPEAATLARLIYHPSGSTKTVVLDLP